MELKKCITSIRCDVPGCKNVANYYINNKALIFRTSMYFCEKCVNELHDAFGKIIVPKSPVNMLNNKSKKRIK